MDESVREYLATIGKKGGRKSKRNLSSLQAHEMLRVREAKRAFKKFHSSCFWSFKKDLKIKSSDIKWVAEQLKKHGNKEAWIKARTLCP